MENTAIPESTDITESTAKPSAAPTRPGDGRADGTDPQAVRRALQAFLEQRCRTSPAVRAVVSRVVAGGSVATDARGPASAEGTEASRG